MKPKRILQVTSVLNIGGIETLIMNIFRNIDREKIIFDFLVVREDNGFFEDEIKAMGGKIYKVPSLKKVGYLSFKKSIDMFFKSHNEYEIVHSHINSFSSIILKSAQENGIKTRIAHAHTSFPKYSFAERMIKNHFKKSILQYGTDFLACSKDASDWLFGKLFSNSIILKNGINTEEYLFSNEARKEVRSKLNIKDKLVIINIGRFSEEKNHSFLVSVFKEIVRINPNSVLICIGNGNLKGKIKKRLVRLSLTEKVLLLDATPNISEYLNASDVYVSTSLFEGFGNSVAEAQINSLPCILSNAFPKEINIFGKCTFLSLKDSPEHWAEVITKAFKARSLIDTETIPLGYQITDTVKTLTDFYLSK